MKFLSIKYDNVAEVKQWCEENIGSENYRWWFTSAPLSRWDSAQVKHISDSILHIDVTEEEERKLTFFMLRWS
jgi:hypothetical protein